MGSINQSIGPRRIYIAGSTGGSSIAPPAHNFIAQKLGKEWTTGFLIEPTAQRVMDVFRGPEFAGGIVTMPHKKAIIPYLDTVDELVSAIGACNVVYLNPEGRLHGTNTDWAGITGALLAAPPCQRDSPALVYGAGGASRAAIYALSVKLGYRDIYIINRDLNEVTELEDDIKAYESLTRPTLVHVKTISQAMDLPPPACIISTVPDFEPKTSTEIETRNVLVEFLSRQQDTKGILLDMCYHPRTTRNVELALRHGWAIVEGIEVVGYQLKLQWKLWTDEEISELWEKEAMAILHQCANTDPSVTPVEKNS